MTSALLIYIIVKNIRYVEEFFQMGDLLAMNYLSDDLLIDAYEKALELDLDDYFIQLLSDELHHRDIHDQTNDLCTV